jgi:tungstate transport system ATP-binding protein
VKKSYGGTFSLEVDQLDVPAREVFCLLGPSGAGKSTLLRMLAGLEPPDCGEVRFGEYRLDGPSVPSAVQRRVTMVFQRPLLLTGSVRENVGYGLRLRGSRRNAEIVESVLERLGLLRLADQPAGTLSGGQAQLVALARALVLEPDMLLLDEPTANLDPTCVARVEGELLATQRLRGMTMLWATHNLFQARRVSQWAGLLLDGRLVEVAPSPSFFEKPSDPRTAAFVQGRMVY